MYFDIRNCDQGKVVRRSGNFYIHIAGHCQSSRLSLTIFLQPQGQTRFPPFRLSFGTIVVVRFISVERDKTSSHDHVPKNPGTGILCLLPAKRFLRPLCPFSRTEGS